MQYNTTGLWIWYFRIISFHVYPCITSTSTCLMAHAVSQPQVQEMRRVSLNWRWRKLVQHTAVPRPSSEVPAASVVEGFCVQKLRPRSGTRLRLYRHYPCSCGGLNMRKAIYIYIWILWIYIDSMADHWQVFLVALAVELFRKSLLALRYLRETLQKKTLAFTFWLESRRALNCLYQAWWFQTLKESLESMQYKVDWSFVLDCSS